jgi:hypothetical protein
MGCGCYRFVGHQPNAIGVDTVLYNHIISPRTLRENQSGRRLLYAQSLRWSTAADGTGSINENAAHTRPITAPPVAVAFNFFAPFAQGVCRLRAASYATRNA